MPSKLNIKNSSLIICLFGFLIGIFWLTYLSQIGILSFIDTFGAFWSIFWSYDFRLLFYKRTLNNKDIYSMEVDGTYFYSGGWHIKEFILFF